MDLKFQQFCLKWCYRLAKKSPDPSNQNGAIVLLGSMTVGEGCNSFPDGTKVTDALLKDRDWKIFNIEHAERNAVFSMLRSPDAFRAIADNIENKSGVLTMVCPWFACDSCARAITLSGIKHVVGHQDRMDKTPDRWKASVAAGLELLKDNGVTTEFYRGKLGGCEPILVNGTLWES